MNSELNSTKKLSIILNCRILIPGIFLFLIIFMSVGCGSGGGGSGSNDSSPSGGSSAGFAQKGPFVSGTDITFWELDNNLNRSGANYRTITYNDAGAYSVPDSMGSRYAELVATGLYYDEVSGQISSSKISLRAICDLTSNRYPNVNILTTLVSDRILYLVANNGLSFSDARQQAEAEVLVTFGILIPPSAYFDQMDIGQRGRDNAILLLLSSIFQGNNTAAQLSELVSDISDDMLQDGTLDSAVIINELSANSDNLDLTPIMNNLSAYYFSRNLAVDLPDADDFSDIYYLEVHKGFAQLYGPGSSCVGRYQSGNAGAYSYDSASNILAIDGDQVNVTELNSTTMTWDNFPGYIRYFDFTEPVWTRVSSEADGIVGTWRLERDHFTVELSFHELGSYGFDQDNDALYGCYPVTATTHFVDLYGPGASCTGGYHDHYAGTYMYDGAAGILTIDGLPVNITGLNTTTMSWERFPEGIDDGSVPVWTRVSGEEDSIIGKWRLEREHFTVELEFHELGSYGFDQDNGPLYGCNHVTSSSHFVDIYGPGSSCSSASYYDYAGTYTYNGFLNTLSIDGIPVNITGLDSTAMTWENFPEGIDDDIMPVWTKISGEDDGIIATWRLERDYFTADLSFHELGSYGYIQRNDPLYGCYN